MASTSSPFVHHSVVRFSDTDALGHVNHARFLSYLEDARIALLAAAARGGPGLQEVGCILAHLEIDYRRPVLLHPDRLTTTVWVTRLGSSSVEMGYRLEQSDAVVAEASSVLVAYDYAAARSRPLTGSEREGLGAYLAA